MRFGIGGVLGMLGVLVFPALSIAGPLRTELGRADPGDADRSLVAFADLKATVSDVRALYGGHSSYARIVNFWQEKISNRVSSMNVFGGRVYVEPYGVNNEGFMVTYTGVPKASCVRLVTREFDEGLAQVRVGNEIGPFSMERAVAVCGDRNMLTWVFR